MLDAPKRPVRISKFYDRLSGLAADVRYLFEFIDRCGVDVDRVAGAGTAVRGGFVNPTRAAAERECDEQDQDRNFGNWLQFASTISPLLTRGLSHPELHQPAAAGGTDLAAF